MIYGELFAEDFYNIFCNWSSLLSDEDFDKVNAILEQGYSSENIIAAMKYYESVGISYYYDKEEDRFWSSEYYYKKHKQFIEEQPGYDSQGLK